MKGITQGILATLLLCPSERGFGGFPVEGQPGLERVAASPWDTSWEFVPIGRLRGVYDSNILISSDDETDDFYSILSTGLAVGRGPFRPLLAEPGTFVERFAPLGLDLPEEPESYLFAAYIPSLTNFLSNTAENSLDHDAQLRGQWILPRLTLGFNARFTTLNLPDPDIGGRVSRRLFRGGLTARYHYSGRTWFDAALTTNIRDYEESVDSADSQLQMWMNYAVQPRTTIGVGVTGGIVEVSEGPSQSYQQLLVRGKVQTPSRKIEFRASGGVELRAIDGAGERWNPVFRSSISYTPRETTELTLEGFSTTTTSAQFAQNSTTTGVELRFLQYFWTTFALRAAAGYQNIAYDETISGSGSDRTDDFLFARASLGWNLNRWLYAEIGGEWRENDSSVAERSFGQTTLFTQLSLLF